MSGRDDKRTTKGNKYQIRGEKIMRNSQLLLNDRLTPKEFLDRIVYKENNLDFGLVNMELVNDIVDEEDCFDIDAVALCDGDWEQ